MDSLRVGSVLEIDPNRPVRQRPPPSDYRVRGDPGTWGQGKSRGGEPTVDPGKDGHGGNGTVGPGGARGGKPVVSPGDGGHWAAIGRGGTRGFLWTAGHAAAPVWGTPDGRTRGGRRRTEGHVAAPGRGGDGAAAARGSGDGPGRRGTEPLLGTGAHAGPPPDGGRGPPPIPGARKRCYRLFVGGI